MAQIYRVMLRCPQSKSILDTGIRTSGREALNNNVYRQGMINCRSCSQFHPIDVDAFIEADLVSSGDSLWRPNP